MPFPAKTPDEAKLITFDFSLQAGSTIVLSNPEVEATLVSGSGDASDLTLGAPTVDGRKVYVLASGGVDGAKYRISCEVDASNAERHQCDKDLPVSAKAALVA